MNARDAVTWRCEAFIYSAASHGFHRVALPVARALGGAA